MNAETRTTSTQRVLLDARVLMKAGWTPVARAIAGRLLAEIGQRCLAGKTPFDTTSGSYRMSCWLTGEHHLYLSIVPSDYRVDIEVQHGPKLYSARITVPGEIVGMDAGDGYTSVYFSLARDERHANLFGLLSVIGTAIETTAFHTADSEKTAFHLGIQSGYGIA
jgi:hypothetical protein